MLKLSSILACAALVAVPATALAQDAKPKSAQDKMVCKRAASTGWRLSASKICKTRAEWDMASREARQEMDNYGRTGSQGDVVKGN